MTVGSRILQCMQRVHEKHRKVMKASEERRKNSSATVTTGNANHSGPKSGENDIDMPSNVMTPSPSLALILKKRTNHVGTNARRSEIFKGMINTRQRDFETNIAPKAVKEFQTLSHMKLNATRLLENRFWKWCHGFLDDNGEVRKTGVSS